MLTVYHHAGEQRCRCGQNMSTQQLKSPNEEAENSSWFWKGQVGTFRDAHIQMSSVERFEWLRCTLWVNNFTVSVFTAQRALYVCYTYIQCNILRSVQAYICCPRGARLRHASYIKESGSWIYTVQSCSMHVLGFPYYRPSPESMPFTTCSIQRMGYRAPAHRILLNCST